MTDEEMTKKELMEKLRVLDIKDKDKKKAVVCALIGHSNIISVWFGYVSCGRCGERIGDALVGYYDNSDVVIMEGVCGKGCETCRKNYERMTWRDKYLVPDPFVEEEK